MTQSPFHSSVVMTTEFDGDVLISLYGKTCRHLSPDDADAFADEIKRIAALARQHGKPDQDEAA